MDNAQNEIEALRRQLANLQYRYDEVEKERDELRQKIYPDISYKKRGGRVYPPGSRLPLSKPNVSTK